jgi:RND family efflux transporter MFP subunit
VNNLTIANSELVIKQAGATSEQIAAQEAQISQVKAQLADARAAYSKSIITAPISGVVTNIDAKEGEIVSPNSPVIYLISEGLQIEANLPEADIAKVSIGNSANVTLDAYGSGEMFEAKVIKIDPAETIIEGVATYKITLQFSNGDERVKPGMTANIDIQTSMADGVIFVPQRAVITTGTGKYVRVLEGEVIVEKDVKTGLRSTDGNIEIVSGLEEGEKVITIIRD